MFRHKNTNSSPVENKKEVENEKTTPVEAVIASENKPVVKIATPKTDVELTKELLEKNLKWSQIIYEQNRKINGKLMWIAVGSWFKVLLIAVPLILAIWFLPPVVKDLQSKYGGLLGGKTSTSTTNVGSFDQLLKMLPLDPAKQEQLKALLK
ncbi:MAG: hypothetical protein A2537_01985 [Candidatus Magasanikbacteria bacterium RIFOXYD2_FULL_36_9]|uniref:Uncharacterized protein n=1 Tax=Candidatus Magasanikbacteria bacterium RIFOXYD2_FULL_36_9 TaxID=1798707 RepID=A0A1F6P228_9BACT|nr:MAG: hypothetical protein A2537_01985 [Candidatus Magasanikbacteria bacterium RIFOXYD2_FULL_36_9]